MKEFVDRWTNAEEIKIHYLESQKYEEGLTPFVYVPGALNYAEQSIEFMEYFKQRRCISMSLRGRGCSDAPLNGYAFDDHIKDISAVVQQSQVTNYCLVAYSMGVPFAIKYVAMNSNVKGLIICDYPARYPAIPRTWSERIINNGFVDIEKRHVVEGIQKESRQIDLQDELSSIKVPVLIIKGGAEGTLLKEDEVKKYKENLWNVTIAEMTDSDHNLFEPDIEVLTKKIQRFLRELDMN